MTSVADRSRLLLYQGLLASPASWARVGRGYLRAWLRAGETVAAVRTRGFRYAADFPLPEELSSAAGTGGLQLFDVAEVRSGPPPRIGLGFLHPPHVHRLLGSFRANLFVWEADAVPASWIPFLAELDAVVVPSEFTRRAIEAGGLPSERVIVAPYGYDPPIVSLGHGGGGICGTPGGRADARSGRRFRFLCVAAPHWRKGLAELCSAYAQTFSRTDDVELRFKTTYDPGASRRRAAFEIASWERLFADSGLSEAGAPRVEVELTTQSDAEVMEGYRQAEVYVGPSWGESFGLAHLEAAASGLPVIATAWGGPTEYLPEGPDLVAFQLAPADHRATYEAAPGARVALPEVEALGARLRWHYENPAASEARGRELREHLKEWTWERAAGGLLEKLREAETRAGS